MAIVDITNRSLRCFGLPAYIVTMLAHEPGWRYPIDVLMFLRYEFDGYPEHQNNNIRSIERKLTGRTPGFGPARTKLVIDALVKAGVI